MEHFCFHVHPLFKIMGWSTLYHVVLLLLQPIGIYEANYNALVAGVDECWHTSGNMHQSYNTYQPFKYDTVKFSVFLAYVTTRCCYFPEKCVCLSLNSSAPNNHMCTTVGGVPFMCVNQCVTCDIITTVIL